LIQESDETEPHEATSPMKKRPNQALFIRLTIYEESVHPTNVDKAISVTDIDTD